MRGPKPNNGPGVSVRGLPPAREAGGLHSWSSMTTPKRFAVATAIAIVMVGVEFLVVLQPGLSVPGLVRVALANINLIPFAVAVRLAGGSDPNLVVVGIVAFLQWFLVGLLVSLLFGRRRRPPPGSGNLQPRL